MPLEIKVLNRNKNKIADMFDGILYEFKPNEPVKIPQEAANHIFGVVFPEDVDYCNSEAFRSTIFLHLQRRWGWNNFDPLKMDAARKAFDNIILTPVILELVEKEKTEVTLPEPRAEKEAPKSAGKFKPRAEEPGEEEEVA